MIDHEALENSVAAWVLGATDPEESARIASHVDGCPVCRELAGRVARAVEELPLAVEDVAPPPRLRERILAAAAQPAPAEEPERKIIPLRPRREARRPPAWIRWQGAAVAALAVAVVGLGSWNVSLSQQVAQAQPKAFQMHGTGAMVGAQAGITYYPRDHFAFVDFSSMPATGRDKVYQLWLIPASGAPVAAGTFQPDASGQASLVVHRSMAGMKVMAVTVENGPSGATAPTQQPQLAANLA